jgi:predicted RNase H-like nuclease (RuvC/YqgF family)
MSKTLSLETYDDYVEEIRNEMKSLERLVEQNRKELYALDPELLELAEYGLSFALSQNRLDIDQATSWYNDNI